ncbi:probable pseudouridine-5'-phosphatase isoform X3 [Stomoxys calcitrans]|uniref:probable pseudouridine-5'-phosphatase isoform X3 n=1 Tax=Stomoxys calcitrans TaxID=35570 RepID=UPI0027E2675B|nr:probable pseudouridine-5'-phosphatase isoform X3 [Stomoxys calcitrans]XP_059221054.1 probable pseudouridine-5'-phosphatase isoform X3 [Stomoxys calcitrans]
MAEQYKKVTHCIFDMDGLLLDTEKVYEEIIRQIAQSFDKPYPTEVRLKVMGTTEPRTAEIVVADLSLPITTDEFLHKFHELCRQMLSGCPLTKGAERLLKHLHKHNIPFCLATSSGQDMVEVKITHHQELFKLFNHRVCGSSDPEVKNGKPAPDIFLIAASRFPDKPQPSQCLVFEDAPNGVMAAHSAGMQVVMVPDERVPLEMSSLATQRLLSLEEFQPELYGLPPFDN